MIFPALQPLTILGLILVTGYFSGKAANLLRLPRISGYIVAGLLFSPSITGIIPYQQISHLFLFTSELALAFIAYSIGGSLRISRIRDLGKEIIWINLSEGTGAFVCTCAAVYFAQPLLSPVLHESDTIFTSVILILGGISVATAPAATMAVMHELRARGPLSTTLLGVVALDDALSIILFSASLTFAGQLLLSNADNYLIMQGALTIVGSLLMGGVGGLLFGHFFQPDKRPESNLMLSLGAILLVSGISNHLGFSPLLANMTMGFFIINRVKHADDLFHQLDIIEETIFCLFFTLAAAHFDLKVFKTSAMLGVIILLGRFAGKLGGTFIGGRISKASPQIYRNLGLALLPQAGLSLGLVFLAEPVLPTEIFDMLLSAILVSIIVNEIISPPLVKWAISNAGETHVEESDED
jgi:Kef-type K+ transport system membrane component KefB